MSGAARTRERIGPAPWVWVAIGLSVLTVINMSFAGDPTLDLGETSYGQSPAGFGAVYDLLSELDPHVQRSRTRYAELATTRSVWLLAPDFLSPLEAPEHGELNESSALRDELDAWIARGGTAIVFGTQDSDWSRYRLELAPSTQPSPEHHPTGPWQPPPKNAPHVALPSTRAPQLRAVEVAGLRNFDQALPEGFTRVLGKADAPFAVQQRIGKGSLIAVADVRLLSNELLDGADHANLAVDLARAFGAPLFDERCHGLMPDRSLAMALGRGRFLLLVLGMGLCVLLALWHLRSVPESSTVRGSGLDPGLQNFVDSLALLYSRKAPRDVEAAYRAYLHGVRFRMRQQLYGARGGSEELLAQRLERDFASQPGRLARLRGEKPPHNERELQLAVRDMERCVANMSDRRGERGDRRSATQA